VVVAQRSCTEGSTVTVSTPETRAMVPKEVLKAPTRLTLMLQAIWTPAADVAASK
jgi:hypothetical protein